MSGLACGAMPAKTKRKVTPWVFTPEVVEDLHSMYGILSAEEIAKRLSSKHGRRFTRYTVTSAARKHGITRMTAQPYVTMTEASQALGVHQQTLLHYCHRNNLRLIGRGVHVRYLAEETWERLQADFKAPPEPTIGTGEAARRLHYTVAAIQRLIARDKITAYRFGGRWRVPLTWVETQERAQRGGRLIGDERRKA